MFDLLTMKKLFPMLHKNLSRYSAKCHRVNYALFYLHKNHLFYTIMVIYYCYWYLGVFWPCTRRRKNRQKVKVVAAVWVRNSLNFIQYHRFSTRMVWWKGGKEERTLGRMDASEKYGYRLVHTTPNCHPPKMDVLLKTFLQIIHAASPPNSSDDLCLLFCLFLLWFWPFKFRFFKIVFAPID